MAGIAVSSRIMASKAGPSRGWGRSSAGRKRMDALSRPAARRSMPGNGPIRPERGPTRFLPGQVPCGRFRSFRRQDRGGGRISPRSPGPLPGLFPDPPRMPAHNPRRRPRQPRQGSKPNLPQKISRFFETGRPRASMRTPRPDARATCRRSELSPSLTSMAARTAPDSARNRPSSRWGPRPVVGVQQGR